MVLLGTVLGGLCIACIAHFRQGGQNIAPLLYTLDATFHTSTCLRSLHPVLHSDTASLLHHTTNPTLPCTISIMPVNERAFSFHLAAV